ncbi:MULTISPECIES: vWA domain-containing protein [unclassified Saccharothrix]|uniref:vWA domain-containing protein n=1 Tax=unclassified Saccharothrix TaxID=2593673 RepID=UPI00307DD3EB
MRRALLLVVLLLAACTATTPPAQTLTVLAGAELADLEPVLARLRRDTGVELRFDLRGTVRASEELARGRTGHDLAWLSSTRYLKLLGASLPLSTSVMLSPVVVGVKRGKADALRSASWADVAARAGSGSFKYLMADPRVTGSGSAALIGVATAAAGTGAALRDEDVRCDKLQGFLAGRAPDPPAAESLFDEYLAREADLDAVLTYESTVVRLNASGRLREPLEVVRPRDGIVLADYPLMLLDPDKRAVYDKVVAWLRDRPAQEDIMGHTGRRPVDPAVPRPAELGAELGTSLYFPATQKVLDTLLAAYDRAGRGSRVVFALDWSTSMRGARIAELRSAFASLSGFEAFHVGERITVVRFAGTVLAEHTTTIRSPADVAALNDFLASDDLRDGTAIWSALDHAHRQAGEGAVVLMTDGENNAGIGPDEFLAAWRGSPARTYAIPFGEADPAELARVADETGGRLVPATEGSLAEAVEEIRGCR